MTQRKCSNCDNYKKQGHNYCRMCGYHLTKGFVQQVKKGVVYNTNEKFCGYCGGEKKDDCSCYAKGTEKQDGLRHEAHQS